MSREPDRDPVCVLPWTHIANTVDGMWAAAASTAPTNPPEGYYRQETEPEFLLDRDALDCSPLSRYARANPDRTMGPREAFNSPT